MSLADPSICPLCLRANECGMVKGSAECWCETVTIPAAVLERVPEPLKRTVCVCRRCAEGADAPKGGTPAR